MAKMTNMNCIKLVLDEYLEDWKDVIRVLDPRRAYKTTMGQLCCNAGQATNAYLNIINIERIKHESHRTVKTCSISLWQDPI